MSADRSKWHVRPMRRQHVADLPWLNHTGLRMPLFFHAHCGCENPQWAWKPGLSSAQLHIFSRSLCSLFIFHSFCSLFFMKSAIIAHWSSFIIFALWCHAPQCTVCHLANDVGMSAVFGCRRRNSDTDTTCQHVGDVSATFPANKDVRFQLLWFQSKWFFSFCDNFHSFHCHHHPCFCFGHHCSCHCHPEEVIFDLNFLLKCHGIDVCVRERNVSMRMQSKILILCDNQQTNISFRVGQEEGKRGSKKEWANQEQAQGIMSSGIECMQNAFGARKTWICAGSACVQWKPVCKAS